MKCLLRGLAIIFAVTGLFLIALICWWKFGERKRIHDAVVASAHLANIPDSEYRAVTKGNMFGRTYWISFRCNDDAFNQFVASSEGLKDVVPYRFPYSESDPIPTTWDQPPEYTRDAMREAKNFWELLLNGQLEGIKFEPSSTSRKKGRRYEISIPKEAIRGELIRDDETGETLLRVSYS